MATINSPATAALAAQIAQRKSPFLRILQQAGMNAPAPAPEEAASAPAVAPSAASPAPQNGFMRALLRSGTPEDDRSSFEYPGPFPRGSMLPQGALPGVLPTGDGGKKAELGGQPPVARYGGNPFTEGRAAQPSAQLPAYPQLSQEGQQALQRYQQETTHKPMTLKQKLLHVGLALAPIGIGAAVGGVAGAAGAAEGENQLRLQNRQQNQMQAARDLDIYQQADQDRQRQYGTDVQGLDALARLREEANYHDMLAGARANSREAALPTTTVMENGQPTAYQWNPASQRYDIRVGVAPTKEPAPSVNTPDGRSAFLVGHPDFGQQMSPTDRVRYILTGQLATQPTAPQEHWQAAGIDPKTGQAVLLDTRTGQTRLANFEKSLQKPQSVPAAALAKAKQADVILQSGQELIDDINKHRGLIGPFWGRVHNEEMKVGINNPDVADLYTRLKSFAALQPALHGARGLGYAQEFENAAGDLRRSPDDLINSIRALMDQAQAFKDAAGPYQSQKFVGSGPTNAVQQLKNLGIPGRATTTTKPRLPDAFFK